MQCPEHSVSELTAVQPSPRNDHFAADSGSAMRCPAVEGPRTCATPPTPSSGWASAVTRMGPPRDVGGGLPHRKPANKLAAIKQTSSPASVGDETPEVADPADQLRRRRAASYRMQPLADGRRDPLDPKPGRRLLRVLSVTTDTATGLALLRGAGSRELAEELALTPQWSESGRGWLVDAAHVPDLIALGEYRHFVMAGACGMSSRNGWARHYQSAWHERSGDPRLPLWLRVSALAYGSHGANGHAMYKSGQVGLVLSKVDETTGEILTPCKQSVHRAIETAIEYGFLEKGSGSLCLVVPGHANVGGLGRADEPCPQHRRRGVGDR
jgi:hypothetical protein